MQHLLVGKCLLGGTYFNVGTQKAGAYQRVVLIWGPTLIWGNTVYLSNRNLLTHQTW